jgi:hypothetical protein
MVIHQICCQDISLSSLDLVSLAPTDNLDHYEKKRRGESKVRKWLLSFCQHVHMLLNNSSPVDFGWRKTVVQAGVGHMAERDR